MSKVNGVRVIRLGLPQEWVGLACDADLNAIIASTADESELGLTLRGRVFVKAEERVDGRPGIGQVVELDPDDLDEEPV